MLTKSRTSSPAGGRRGALPLLTLAACLLAAALAPQGAGAADPPLLRQFCETGSATGQCTIPRGIAVDRGSGEVYVADQSNSRIEKFDAWGEFVLAWGWGVADGSAELQSCTASCQKGLTGAGAGEFGAFGPQGIALDSAAGVYVVDQSNRRVQKFDSEGGFEWMIGGEVNKTKTEESAPEAQRNLCPVDPGDVCQAGVEGAGQGQFGAWKVGSYVAVDTKGSEEAGDDVIYVGDVNRIQSFDAAGAHLGEIPFSGGSLPEPGTVGALAFDPKGGEIYFDYATKLAPYPSAEAIQPDVHRIDPASGEETGLLEVDFPGALAVDNQGEVYVYGKTVFVSNGDPRNHPSRILRFDPAGELVETSLEGALGSTDSTGIAVNSAPTCNLSAPDLFVSHPNSGNSYVRLYGPPPDPAACPPPKRAPRITDQYATSVAATGASVAAAINPRFWVDTAYRVQYGTGRCSEGGCPEEAPAAPGRQLPEAGSANPVPAPGVFLEDLQPATTYHFRFIAVSSGGGPVYGIDPDGEGPAEPSPAEGLEGTFRTFPAPLAAKTDCPNQAFRTGLSAPLPDCRAYELVSPADKNGGDIETDPYFLFGLAAADGERATYTSFTSFAGPEGSPLNSPYLASREAGEGWASHAISPPRSSVAFYPPLASVNSFLFKAFSEDLCQGWLLQDNDVALTPGAPAGVANFYRRSDRDCGPEGYELLTPIAPPGFDFKDEVNEEVSYAPELQGLADDGELALLRINAALTPDACKATIEAGEEVTVSEGKGLYQLYLQGPGAADPNLVSVLPHGGAACVHASAGTAQGQLGEFREASVQRAIAADGSRVYWSTSARTNNQTPTPGGGRADQAGPLFLRLNPAELPSATAAGGAAGSGELTGPAKGKGTLVAGNTTVFGVTSASGRFVPGQELADPGGLIAAGTKIVSVEEKEVSPGVFEVEKLKLSTPPSGSKAGAELSAASRTVSGPVAESGEFAVGQSIAGPDIPAGATIVAVAEEEVSPGVFEVVELTLSAAATGNRSGAPLEAWSACIDPQRACTVRVSGAPDTRFWAADPQGERALYTAAGGLYEYDAEAEESTAIAASGVLGVTGASTDLARVYFASTAVLSGGQENSFGEKAIAGRPNLYLRERGGEAVFIATLSGRDAVGGALASLAVTPPSPITAMPRRRAARVSGNGLHAAFTTAASLGGYDNTDAVSGEPDAEVYLYDAEVGGGPGELRCISCNPSGARPRGAKVAVAGGFDIWHAAALPGWPYQLYASRLLAEDGGRLFFQSFDALVLRDTNGKADVYEWQRAASEAECEEKGAELHLASAGGCISLISSGQGGEDAHLLDASRGGRDVLFTTSAGLVAQDAFGLVDVYDAREGGGFAPPEAPAPPCEGEACQPHSPPPDVQTPASAAFGGEGAIARRAAPCAGAARRAQRTARAAKRLRRAARSAPGRSRARALRRASRRRARQARRLTRNAKRCRARQGRRAAR